MITRPILTYIVNFAININVYKIYNSEGVDTLVPEEVSEEVSEENVEIVNSEELDTLEVSEEEVEDEEVSEGEVEVEDVEDDAVVRRSTRQRRPPTIFTYDQVGGNPEFRQQPFIGAAQTIHQLYGYCCSCYTMFKL